jgi:hypothetical protein
MEVDDTDPKKRARFRRVLDKIHERALGDTLTAQKAAEEYSARVAGKPISPVDVTGAVTHQSVEAQVTSILKNLDRLKQAPKPVHPVTETVQ